MFQMLKSAPDALFRIVADGAGVEKDNVTPNVVALLTAALHPLVIGSLHNRSHYFTVCRVLLTPVAFDCKGLGFGVGWEGADPRGGGVGHAHLRANLVGCRGCGLRRRGQKILECTLVVCRQPRRLCGGGSAATPAPAAAGPGEGIL